MQKQSKVENMIQRVQSLFLFMTTVLSCLFLTGTVINFTDENNNKINIKFSGIENLTDAENIEKVTLLSIMLVLVPLISFLIIFLFKNRKLQMRMTLILILLIVAEIILTGFYVYYITSSYNAELTFSIKLIIPVLMLISSLLAYRYIKKDEELVRSYDRLR